VYNSVIKVPRLDRKRVSEGEKEKETQKAVRVAEQKKGKE
jgi:hypothetical protein